MNDARPQFKWPLAVSHFSITDKLQLASFFITAKRWTHDRMTVEFEKRMAEYVGAKFAIFTSSGSTANQLLAMHTRNVCGSRNVVVLPAVTWSTSFSPWLREGFEPYFIDIHPMNLGMNLDILDNYLSTHSQNVACVFITSLLGFSPDIARLIELSKKHGVTVMLDNCEATLTEFDHRNISSYFTSTTSTYFGHFIQTIEGGFVFTDDPDLYVSCVMMRDHGLSRCLKISPFIKHTGDFDPVESWKNQFHIQKLGSNFRNTEIGARLGLMELKRIERYRTIRKEQELLFRDKFNNKSRITVPCGSNYSGDILFALPIITSFRADCIKICTDLGIETRPLVCGNILRHSALKSFFPYYYATSDISKFDLSHGSLSEAQAVHDHGFYVGLGKCAKSQLITILAQALNRV